MKKVWLLLALSLLLTVSGCKRQSDPPAEEEFPPAVEETVKPAVPAGPLEVETLRVEISRNAADTALVVRVARELPDLLQTYFAEAQTPVNIGRVAVTVGATPAATAQSLAQDGVDLAFLPAESFALGGGEAQVLLGNAPQPAILPKGDSTDIADWNRGEKTYAYAAADWVGGTGALICAAPTDYGRQLAKRAESGKNLTWTELDKARWGVLEEDSLGGYRCANLYLTDHYEGDTLADLSNVTVYDSYEDLLRAAANETVDIVVLRKDARMDVSAAWLQDLGRADENGLLGFGRTAPVWEEVRCIAVTETLYDTVAAVAPGREDLSGEAFASALLQVLERLYEEEPELMGTLGSARFAPVNDEALDPLRRALTVEGKTA